MRKKARIIFEDGILDIVFSPTYAADGLYFVRDFDSILRTNDRGKDLEPIASMTAAIIVLAPSTDFANDKTVFIGTGVKTYPDLAWRPNVDKSGVFRSVDGGKHWKFWLLDNPHF